jgi:hypothetical protein
MSISFFAGILFECRIDYWIKQYSLHIERLEHGCLGLARKASSPLMLMSMIVSMVDLRAFELHINTLSPSEVIPRRVPDSSGMNGVAFVFYIPIPVPYHVLLVVLSKSETGIGTSFIPEEPGTRRGRRCFIYSRNDVFFGRREFESSYNLKYYGVYRTKRRGDSE